jgi:hypothetical protein
MDDNDAAWAQAELDERHRRENEMREINEIAAALAKAQCEMSNPGFDSTNPHFRNKYASLAAVRNATIPVLARHGVSVIQDVKTADNGVSCETILTHSSGQQMRLGPLVLPVSKADAQGYGSAITYARRYHLMAVAGVVGDADDDAEGAVGRSAAVERVSAEQAQALQALAEEAGADLRRFCEYFKIGALAELPANRLEEARKALLAKRKREQQEAA